MAESRVVMAVDTDATSNKLVATIRREQLKAVYQPSAYQCSSNLRGPSMSIDERTATCGRSFCYAVLRRVAHARIQLTG